MNSVYPFIPSDINSRMSELGFHKYWGHDFLSQTSEYLLVEIVNGKRALVITYGKWNEFPVKMGDAIILEHTQSGAKKHARALAVVNIENVQRRIEKYGDMKLPTWTLK